MKRNDVVYRIAWVLPLLLSSCRLTAVDVEAECQALLERDRAWAAAASAGDLDRLWDFWSEDAVIRIEGQEEIRGQEAIRQFVLRNRERPGFEIDWTPEGAEVAGSGDMGYTWGPGRRSWLDENGERVEIVVTYLTIWRKGDDGVWRGVLEK